MKGKNIIRSGLVDGLLYKSSLAKRNMDMSNKETAVKGYTDEMEMGEFLGDVYRGVSHIRAGIWCLVILELAKFVLW